MLKITASLVISIVVGGLMLQQVSVASATSNKSKPATSEGRHKPASKPHKKFDTFNKQKFSINFYR